MEKIILAASLGLLVALTHAAAESPYRGQEIRGIKALSAADIQAYRSGSGMGLARAAELNHYPGPRHVLDLANELKLTPSQARGTRDLYGRMQSQAAELGERIINRERELDKLFAQGAVDSKTLKSVLNEIGQLHAKLRYVHLNAHVEQKKLLTKHQVLMYDKFRGYDSSSRGAHGHSHD